MIWFLAGVVVGALISVPVWAVITEICDTIYLARLRKKKD